MTWKQTKKNDDEWMLHYGVLGMKWGVRKDRRSGSSKSSGKSSGKKTSSSSDTPSTKSFESRIGKSSSTMNRQFDRGKEAWKLGDKATESDANRKYNQAKRERDSAINDMIDTFGAKEAARLLGVKKVKKSNLNSRKYNDESKAAAVYINAVNRARLIYGNDPTPTPRQMAVVTGASVVATVLAGPVAGAAVGTTSGLGFTTANAVRQRRNRG